MSREIRAKISVKEHIRTSEAPAPMRVLISADDPMSQQLLASMVSNLGHEVFAISEGLSVEGLPAREDINPESETRIAILDHSISGGKCRNICREVRKRFGSDIYIILLTPSHLAGRTMTDLGIVVDDFLLKPFTEAELCARLRLGVRVLNLLAGHIETERLLFNAATCDDLTGLWNRRMILNQLAQELNRTKHDKKSLAVAMVDIDLFKSVNDTFGHLAGDSVLRDIAASLRTQLRSYDFIGRYGGEEFLVLLPGCDRKAAADIARRMCQTIASTPMHICDVDVPVSVSIGLSSTADAGFDSATLIAAADEALYRAKNDGRNRVSLCEAAS